MSLRLEYERVGGGRPGPRILITGGVHGDEFEPMAAIRQLISILKDETIRGAITLVPVVNEPAFRLGARVAEDGLDLARTCPGRPDGSVTRRVAFALSEMIRDADYYVDLHTGGTRLRVSPLVGYMLHGDRSVLETQRRMAKAFGLPIIWGTDPNLEGRSLSVARDFGVPAIYAEYHGGGGFDEGGVNAYIAGCLNVLSDLGTIDREAALATSEPLLVEDDRPGAGHMQANHPSPVEGFFEPAVRLGQAVAAGATLGTVTDGLGRMKTSIFSKYSGLVIVLHTFSRIDVGTSVAVILDSERIQVPAVSRA